MSKIINDDKAIEIIKKIQEGPIHHGEDIYRWTTDIQCGADQLYRYLQDINDNLGIFTRILGEKKGSTCVWCGHFVSYESGDSQSILAEIVEHQQKCESSPVALLLRGNMDKLAEANEMLLDYQEKMIEARNKLEKALKSMSEFEGGKPCADIDDIKLVEQAIEDLKFQEKKNENR